MTDAKLDRVPVILVVDDDAESVSLLTDLLRYNAYGVRTAASGKIALAALQTYKPDLILLDVSMPMMDGLEVCRNLKLGDATRNIPVIFISAFSDSDRRVQALNLGAVDFITKPFRQEELLARIRTHLELSRLRGKLGDEVVARTTELSAALHQLRESEQLFRLMADTAQVLIWLAAADSSYYFFNRGWLDFTGRRMDEESGRGWLAGIHDEDLARYVDAYASAFRSRSRFQIEYRLRRADGEYRWMLCRALPRFLSGGEFDGYIGCVSDITDLRRNREEAYDRQRMQSLRVLSSGIAHDFKNLVAAILLQVEDAEMELDAGGSPAEQLGGIRTLASRASEIVSQLMLYSGHDNSTLEPVNVSTLVEEMLELLRVSIPKGTVLETELEPDAPPVWGNPTQIRQIVLNLVINAAEAIGERNGSIHVTTRSVTAGSCAAARKSLPDGRYLRLTVSDTGCGMTEDVCRRVFDPFFTTKRTGQGLGLAVIDGIVRNHNGAIEVESAPGKGSIFEVLLPALAESRARIREHVLQAGAVGAPCGPTASLD